VVLDGATHSRRLILFTIAVSALSASARAVERLPLLLLAVCAGHIACCAYSSPRCGAAICAPYATRKCDGKPLIPQVAQ
jgi:hypothetical protein